MVIHELAQQVGIPPKTIRYYEAIGLLPPPPRGANNYRQYGPADLDRLRLVVGARSLGLPLPVIVEILTARAAGHAPCRHILCAIEQHPTEVDQRIAALLALRTTLAAIHDQGTALPDDDVVGEHCICAVLKTYPPAVSDGDVRSQPRRAS